MTHIDYTTRDPCPSSLVESLKQIPLPVRCSYTQSFLRNHLGKYILFSSFQQWGTTSCLKKYFQISVASLNFRMGNQLTFLQLLNSTFLRRKHVLIFGCQNLFITKRIYQAMSIVAIGFEVLLRFFFTSSFRYFTFIVLFN